MAEYNIPNLVTSSVTTPAIVNATSTLLGAATNVLEAYNNLNVLGIGRNTGIADEKDYSTLISFPSTDILNSLWCNQSLNEYGSFNCSNGTQQNGTKIPHEPEISFILPWWRQVLWSILFGGMVIVATGGNLIVVWIVMTTKRMRTVTNYFIVNLAIADAMVSSLNVTFSYIYMLDNDWPFGELYCKISQFISMLSICASVFTLMAISIDRYVAIMKPLQPRMSKRCNLAIGSAIWIASTIISCPVLLFFTTDTIVLKDGIRTVCYAEWPDGPTNHSQLEHMYNIVFMILTYFLPVISMTVTYSRVGFELWGSRAIGEYTPRQVENVKSKRRVVKMMIIVVLIFAVCWLPFHVYFIVTSCFPAITETPYVQELYLLIYWVAMSNSMYNPIIYCWMNSRFRYGFKMFFRWGPFAHFDDTLNRRDNMTSRYSCSGSPDHNRIKRNDTQRSILYTCPGSPKSRRLPQYGVVRHSTNPNMTRYSTTSIGSGNNIQYYHQQAPLRDSTSTTQTHISNNFRESQDSNKDYIEVAAATKNLLQNKIQQQHQQHQKWISNIDSVDSQKPILTTRTDATELTS